MFIPQKGRLRNRTYWPSKLVTTGILFIYTIGGQPFSVICSAIALVKEHSRPDFHTCEEISVGWPKAYSDSARKWWAVTKLKRWLERPVPVLLMPFNGVVVKTLKPVPMLWKQDRLPGSCSDQFSIHVTEHWGCDTHIFLINPFIVPCLSLLSLRWLRIHNKPINNC